MVSTLGEGLCWQGSWTREGAKPGRAPSDQKGRAARLYVNTLEGQHVREEQNAVFVEFKCILDRTICILRSLPVQNKNVGPLIQKDWEFQQDDINY